MIWNNYDRRCKGTSVLAITSWLPALVFLIVTGCMSNPFSQRDMLVGETTVEAFFERFPDWEKRKNKYVPEESSVKGLHTIEREISLLLFIGTWCSDSREEAPKAIKVYEAANNGNITLRLYGVDTYKKDGAGIAQQYTIERVPTVVVVENGRELGRIVEYPQRAWEEDILKILEP